MAYIYIPRFEIPSRTPAACRVLSLSPDLHFSPASSVRKKEPLASSRLSQSSPPNTMSDEEVTDQKVYLEERCKPKCVKPLYAYRECVKRVENDETGHKHCTGQYFDYWRCVDKCVAEKLFSELK
ncbi:hypothetical protein LUZ60_004182 [Juncus effusus]|nr:hypothetical protein LUZ60_004182 [Juncus effusus]